MINHTETTKPWVSEAEAEAVLGISRRTLLNLRKTGKIPFYKTERRIFYRIDEVVDALKKSTNPQVINPHATR